MSAFEMMLRLKSLFVRRFVRYQIELAMAQIIQGKGKASNKSATKECFTIVPLYTQGLDVFSRTLVVQKFAKYPTMISPLVSLSGCGMVGSFVRKDFEFEEDVSLTLPYDRDVHGRTEPSE